MDRDSIKIYREKKKEGLDRRESIEKLLSLKKRRFQEGKNIERWMQQANYSNKYLTNMLTP